MNVLLMYRWKHHHLMMETLAKMLSERGIKSDVLCIQDYSLTKNSNIKWTPLTLTFGKIINNIRPYRLRELLKKVFDRKIIICDISKYDKVDFHYHTYNNNDLMEGCKKCKVPYDLMLWGSDVNRVTHLDIKKLEYGFANCSNIKGGDILLQKVSSFYSGKYDSKFRTMYFGNSNYRTIDSMNDAMADKIAFQLFGDICGKLIVTIGYNAKKEQQHLAMISALKILDSKTKSKIHVVVPMTYEKTDSYTKEVKKALADSDVSFTVIDRFLSFEELSALRIKTEIVVNMQTTDAFCSAIQEHLYCGNVAIIADWLDYPPYDRNGVFYIKSSLENLSEALRSVINNYTTYKGRTSVNKQKVVSITAWDGVIDSWCDVMKNM